MHPETSSIKKQITDFICWGLIIGVILPLASNLILKSYELRSENRQYLITHLIPQLSESYNTVNKNYFKLTKLEGDLSAQLFLQEQIFRKNKTLMENDGGMKSQDNFFILSLMKKTLKLKNEILSAKINLQSSLNNFSIASTQVAMLLNVTQSTQYQNAIYTYTKANDADNQQYTNIVISYEKEFGLQPQSVRNTIENEMRFAVISLPKIMKRMSYSDSYKVNIDVIKAEENLSISESQLTAKQYTTFQKLYQTLDNIYFKAFLKR